MIIKTYLKYLNENGNMDVLKNKYDTIMSNAGEMCKNFKGARKDSCILSEKIRAIKYYMMTLENNKKTCNDDLCISNISKKQMKLRDLLVSSERQLYDVRQVDAEV